MPSPSIEDIQQYIVQGQTEEALADLNKMVFAKNPALLSEVILLQARLNQSRSKRLGGTITDEDFDVEINRLHRSILEFLVAFSNESKSFDQSKKTYLHEYLSYTCNRSRQEEKFRELAPQQVRKKAHFYYLYGAREQSHRGFIKRLIYELEGGHKLRSTSDASPLIRMLAISPKLSMNYDFYRENILKELFDAFEIQIDGLGFLLNANESLLDKNIAHLMDSPMLKGQNPPKAVFLYIKIAHLQWHREQCVKAARWFIKEFCKPKLMDASPVFMFFFGVEFDEKKPSIREEVEAAVTESKDMFPLPELDKVNLDHIDAWFDDNETFEEDWNGEREAFKKEHFGDHELFDMKFVERKLKFLIDQYNNRQLSQK